MNKIINCFFGMHEYEIYEKVEVKSVTGDVVAYVFISKCKHCGKIRHERIELK